ncbi:MAG: UPF0280 family protein [Actinomycetota bacterium]|nr:UPF0280 family protein [Actinomycetota bacterium]
MDYLHRFYRRSMQAEGLVPFRVVIGESDLFVWAERELKERARDSLYWHRRELEEFINLQPLFGESLRPYEVPSDSPRVVRIMARAAERVGVGPMAAVAGALAEMVGRDLSEQSREVIVENGGDIFLCSRSERKVGIFAGESPLSGRITLRLKPVPGGMGVCTSSATVGPSLSVGKADTALVLASDVALADAAATAMGNRAKDPAHIEDALSWTYGIEGVAGCLVIMGEHLGLKGEIELSEPD